jgi:hypothetical protein
MTESDKQKEAQFNHISNEVIGQTAWGKFYGLMRSASKFGEEKIIHKICLDKDGGEIKVYNTKSNRLLGAFLKPTHEYVQKYLAQKKYGEAFLASLGVYGQSKAVKEMESANCFEVTPTFILEEQAKKEERERIEKENLGKKGNIAVPIYKNKTFVYVSIGLITLCILSFGILKYKKII